MPFDLAGQRKGTVLYPTLKAQEMNLARDTRSSPTTKEPNIVFILVDNVGWGTFGVYGGTIPTPRIDKMANRKGDPAESVFLDSPR